MYVRFTWKTPSLSMHYLQKQINQDIKRKQSKDKDSTVHNTEYRSKRNPTGKPGWAWKQPKHQAPTISSMDKSLCRNRHRAWSPTHRPAIKEESKVANRDGVDRQAYSLLQYINVICQSFYSGKLFKVVPDSPAYVQKVTIFWHVKK